MNKHNTNIDYIGITKRSDDAWSLIYKDIELSAKPISAVLRVQSDNVCGIFVNGEFAEATTGRLPERVVCLELTSRLHPGTNRLALKLGPKYFQKSALADYRRRGFWFGSVAAELQMTMSNGEKLSVKTDDTWCCAPEGGPAEMTVCCQVTCAEYARFWLQAALWREGQSATVPQAVLDTVGSDYEAYRCRELLQTAHPVSVAESVAVRKGESWLLSWEYQTEKPSVVYDFGRLEVGYLRICYRAEEDTTLELAFDYTESVQDFHPTPLPEDATDFNRSMTDFCRQTFETLKMTVSLKKGEKTFFNLHRRAARYIQIALAVNAPAVLIESVEVHRCLAPVPTHGWFQCEEPLLNEMWEMGKYTLHINKHQEYESCPRNEMRFFAGDGLIDETVDYYAFGGWDLTNTSLSLRYFESSAGLAPNELYNKSDYLWDYRGWRIITAYIHYNYTGDREFLERHFNDLTVCMGWLIQRMNRENLIFQTPVRNGSGNDIPVDWSCSTDRFGENPYLNALLYKSLLCMAEMADILGDGRATEWRELAVRVETAFQKRLWSEEQQAYVDTHDTSYVPQDGNALAVLFDLAKGGRVQTVLNTLKRKNWSPYGSLVFDIDAHHLLRSHQISPTMCTHEAEARFRSGDAAGALDLIRRLWGTMINKGAKTFWEYMDDDAATRWPIPAHAWSAGCTYLLSAFVLGVRPGKPGYETLVFAPCGAFEDLHGVVPTVKGPVGVCCTVKDGIRHYTLAIPEKVELETYLPEGAKLTVKRY